MTRAFFGPSICLKAGAARLVSAIVIWGWVLSPAAADPVVLQFGDMRIEGEALGYDGTYLRVATAGGEVTFDLRSARCEGSGCPDPATWVAELRLSGSARLGEVILPALVEGYARSRGFMVEQSEDGAGRALYTLTEGESGAAFARFTFHPTTTADGFADLLADEADAVMAARPPTQMERARAVEAGLGDLGAGGQVLALEGLVPVVAPGQAVRKIDLPELSAILSGEVREWSVLGGAGPINLHLAATNSGQVEGIALRLTGRDLAGAAILHPNLEAATSAVAADPGGLALVPLDAQGLAVPLGLTGACGISLAPRPGAIRTEDYPLSTPLLLYLPERRLARPTRDFLAWLPDPEAQLVLRRAGVMGLAAAPIPLAEQGERLAAAISAAGEGTSLADLQDMVGFLRGKTRLSPTFRFEEGEAALDPVSRSQLRALAQAIRNGLYQGQSLWLVGFSDGLGDAARNLALSEARAEAVANAIAETSGGAMPEGTTLGLASFGEALPLACDDTALGRSLNRRVELWVGAAEPGPEGDAAR